MATSLLELATQIQSMELSFTTILMEAAMKLASLTDANIFMIVDTQEGRRFSGKEYLCNAYLNSQLTPSFGDVQVFVNPSISAVDLKTPSHDQHAQQHFQPHHYSSPYDHLGGLGRNASPSTQKSTAHYPLDNRFRKRTFNGNGSVRRRDTGVNDAVSPAKIPRSSSSTLASSSNATVTAPKVETAAEEQPHLPDSKVKSLYEISDEDDVNDECNLQIVEDSSSQEATGQEDQPQRPQPPPPRQPEADAFATPSPAMSSSVMRRYSSCSSPSSNPPASSWVSSAASLAALEALTTLSDVTLGKIVAAKEFPLEQILTKGSAANKLLCSILYDVVKDISKICADLGFVSAKEGSAKDVFYALLEKFVKENFPSLMTTDLMFYEGSNRMSAIAYIRSKTRVMFFMRMKAIQKKYDSGLNNSLVAPF